MKSFCPSISNPFVFLHYVDDPKLHLICSTTYLKNKLSTQRPVIRKERSRRRDRARIAYLSADFYQHATSYLMAELFERHDRKRFEPFGISFGIDDGSEMRARVVKAFDHFHDVRGLDDAKVAKLLSELEIDIAIDLKGHTRDDRFGIFAHRPAPIQVSYLGYPGTTGADFIDYVIADEIVLPFDQQPFWSEKIVHLPGCYQVNDRKRQIAERTPTRKECGLPERGFGFCSFNNNCKITPPVFDIWMRLLDKVEGSVLWLLRDNPTAEQNLRREAAARGIDPVRLVFADRLQLAEHLARHRLADLFLDTLPYNAHTTASDALWAGLPVLTCFGKGFAARVAASLLDAVGLPELVTKGLEEYEVLALKLAREPALLSAYRERLEKNRPTAPLFDTDRFRQHIEQAYLTMLDIHDRGKKPRSFSVASQLGSRPNSGAVQGGSTAIAHSPLEALASYDRALTINADNATAWSNRAFLLRELGRKEEALASYERSLAIEPNNADMLNNRGVVLLELKRFEEALASFDQALSIEPKFRDGLDQPGNCLARAQPHGRGADEL
jgi:protein O-GlcNAc transferase